MDTKKVLDSRLTTCVRTPLPCRLYECKDKATLVRKVEALLGRDGYYMSSIGAFDGIPESELHPMASLLQRAVERARQAQQPRETTFRAKHGPEISSIMFLSTNKGGRSGTAFHLDRELAWNVAYGIHVRVYQLNLLLSSLLNAFHFLNVYIVLSMRIYIYVLCMFI